MNIQGSQPTSRPYRNQLAGDLSELVTLWWSPSFREELVGGTGKDLGVTEARIVWELGYSGAARPGVLASVMGIGAPSISKAVNKLMSRGFVEKRVDSSDRRAFRLALTPAGTTVSEKLYALGDDMVSTITREWAEAEVIQFTALASRFLAGAQAFAQSLSVAETASNE